MHVAIVQRKTADRRKDRRFPMRGAIDMRAAGINVVIHATLEDISATGCRVSTRAPLRIKHPVRIELPRPGQTLLRVTGHVVRARGATSDRLYYYGIHFRFESDETRAELRAYVSLYASKLAPVRNGSFDRRVAAAGADVKLQLDVTVPEVGRFSAIALALRPDGMRVACDRVLRQEWPMKIDLRLPSESAGTSIVTVRAKALSGVRQVRGQYIQDVEFCEPPLRARQEIERLIFDLKTNGGAR